MIQKGSNILIAIEQIRIRAGACNEEGPALGL